MQFISCTVTACPMNDAKQCRAPAIIVDKQGICETKANGPHTGKSPIEKHVEIKECKNEECDSWEFDEALGKGRCGLESTLSFQGFDKAIKAKAEEVEKGKPVCLDFERQIGSPPWAANV
jgi:hypothetical protein